MHMPLDSSFKFAAISCAWIVLGLIACGSDNADVPSSGEMTSDPNDGGGSAGDTGSPSAGDGFVDGPLCTARFCWQAPVPHGNALLDIHALGDEVFAVGEAGTFMRRRDGAWKVAVTPTTVELDAVFAIAKDDVWAVGTGGTAIHYDGKSFTVIPTNITSRLRALWASASKDVWAAGDDNTIIHWNGSAWVRPAGAFGALPVEQSFRSLWGSSANDVWAIGWSNDPKGGWPVHWDGVTWRTESFDAHPFYAIHGTSHADIWALESQGTYHYDGQGWSLHTASSELAFSQIRVDPAGTVWASTPTFPPAFYVLKKGDARFQPWGTLDPVPYDYRALNAEIRRPTFTVSAGGLWLAGRGNAISHLDETSPKFVSEVAYYSIRSFSMSDDSHGIGLFEAPDKKLSLATFNGTTWKDLSRPKDLTDDDVTMLTDGTAVVLNASAADGCYPSTIVNGTSHPLPPHEPSRPTCGYRVAGSSADDLFIATKGSSSTVAAKLKHWNGSSWKTVDFGSAKLEQISEIVSAGPGWLWIVGRGAKNWVGRVDGDKVTPMNFPSNLSVALLTVAGTKDNLLAAGVVDENGLRRPAVFRAKLNSWVEDVLPRTELGRSYYDEAAYVKLRVHGKHVFLTSPEANYELEDIATTDWKAVATPIEYATHVFITDTAIWLSNEGGLVKSR